MSPEKKIDIHFFISMGIAVIGMIVLYVGAFTQNRLTFWSAPVIMSIGAGFAWGAKYNNGWITFAFSLFFVSMAFLVSVTFLNILPMTTVISCMAAIGYLMLRFSPKT